MKLSLVVIEIALALLFAPPGLREALGGETAPLRENKVVKRDLLWPPGPSRIQAMLRCLSLESGGQAAKEQPTLFIGIDANPPANDPYSAEAIRKSLQRAVDAGATYVHMAPKWNELEPSPQQYRFEAVDFEVGLVAAHQLPIELGVRIVDTNQRSMPASYEPWAFDDPRMAERLNELLRALAPRLRGSAKWITIGNEVDAYFDSHREEIGAYRKLLTSVIGTVRESFPRALFAVNFTSGALSRLHTDYAEITSVVDFISLTYYPLNPDFTVQDPGVAKKDIGRMIQAAGNRKVLFQEVGYPSGAQLKSSEEKQARFLTFVFEALKEHRDRILAANILWMSDLPQSVVDQFGEYYKLPNNENFKPYLATLGLFDQQGRPKTAWQVFQREARSLSRK